VNEGFNRRIGAFTQSYGSDALDASALRLPLVGFLPASDEKMRATIEAIEAALTQDGLVYRYREAKDGLPGVEGTFLICTFWLIQCLGLMGHKQDAQERFDRVLSFGNDVGLFAEEIDAAPRSNWATFRRLSRTSL
jgi:GH15 family glucan-1,4-alpha-glucosidase